MLILLRCADILTFLMLYSVYSVPYFCLSSFSTSLSSDWNFPVFLFSCKVLVVDLLLCLGSLGCWQTASLLTAVYFGKQRLRDQLNGCKVLRSCDRTATPSNHHASLLTMDIDSEFVDSGKTLFNCCLVFREKERKPHFFYLYCQIFTFLVVRCRSNFFWSFHWF